MNSLNQVNIVEVSTEYDVRMSYHSDLLAENRDAIIEVIEGPDNRITILPSTSNPLGSDSFTFKHSDPDRVIAIAQMMMAAAQMIKKS